MTSPATYRCTAPPALQLTAVAALEAIGWSLLAADLDLSSGAIRVELRRADGLAVTLDRDAIGRCSLTREHLVSYAATVGRRGDRCPVDRLRHELIGRDRIVGGPRDALRALAHYVGDNATVPDRRLGRAAIALLMQPVGGDQLVASRTGQGDQGGEARRRHGDIIATDRGGVTTNASADGAQALATEAACPR